LGDRSLATGLQSPPYPQFIGVPNPRRFCGWLCSAGAGVAEAGRTQPILLTLILSLTLVRRWGVVTRRPNLTSPSSKGPATPVMPNATAHGDRSSATWPGGSFAAAIYTSAAPASAAPTVLTRCSSPSPAANRCLCPSCHQKRTLLAADNIADSVCAPVPHRQLVFTIPKRLRIYCRLDRQLLGELARAAWLTVVEVYRQMLHRDDVTPAMVAGIQTFGELIHYHPHIHAIATDGAFASDGTFLCLPKSDSQRLLPAWQTKIFELLLATGKIEQQTVDEMRLWPHSGFSVDNSVSLPPHDTAALQRLAQYILRCPFYLARVVRLTDDGSVIYRAKTTAEEYLRRAVAVSPEMPSALTIWEPCCKKLRVCRRQSLVINKHYRTSRITRLR